MLYVGERKTGFEWTAEVFLCEVHVFMWLHVLAKNSMTHAHIPHVAETTSLASFYQSYCLLQIVSKTAKPKAKQQKKPFSSLPTWLAKKVE